MRQTPALKAALLLALGIWLGYWIPVTPLITFPSLVLILIVAISVKGRISDLFTAFALIIGGFVTVQSSHPPDDFSTFQCTITGRITEPPVLRYNKLSFPLQLDSIHFDDSRQENITGKLWISHCAPLDDLQLGKTVRLYGALSPLKPRRNPGDYDIKAWRERNGYIGTYECDPDSAALAIVNRIPLMDRAKVWILNTADRYGNRNAPIIKGLLLGTRREIDYGFMEALQNTGLAHLISLSGLHVGFLVAMLVCIGSIVRLKTYHRAAFAIIGIIIYAFLVPLRGATLRASIIALVFLSGPMLKRWSSALNSLGLAALIILILKPGDLFDAGFQLSFAATGGLIILYPMFQRYTGFTRNIHPRFIRQPIHYIVGLFIISSIASLSIFPLTSHYFNIMTLLSPFFNLLAVPLLALVYAAAWITTLFALFTPFLASIFADGLDVLTSLWKMAVLFFNEISLNLNLRLAPVFIFAWFGVILYFAFNQAKLWKRALIATLLLLNIIVWGGFRKSSSNVQAWFLDVGHGDATVLRFPEGQTIVVDGGTRPWSNAKPAVVNVLEYFDPQVIDLMVATHPEADHIGGLIDVIDRFPVQTALCIPAVSPSKTYHKLQEVSERNHLKWQNPNDGGIITGLPDYCRLTVVGPPDVSSGWSHNDRSIVLLLEINEHSEDTLRLLLTGDIEKNGENAYIISHGKPAELLKMPHHGSKTSSSLDFLMTVKPHLAVVSRGSQHERGRRPIPEEVLDRYRKLNAEMHKTSDEGAILCEPFFEGDESRWRVVDWRKPSFGRWLFGAI